MQAFLLAMGILPHKLLPHRALALWRMCESLSAYVDVALANHMLCLANWHLHLCVMSLSLHNAPVYVC